MNFRTFERHIITGEYPPQFGGVSDYTHIVAHALANLGEKVHIWAPGNRPETIHENGVTIHRLSDHFNLRGLFELSQGLLRSNPDSILIQYVPHAYGFKAMNVGFCLWVKFLCLRPLDVMFHEVNFPYGPGLPLKYQIMGRIHMVMAWLLGSSSRQIYLSIPQWKNRLKQVISFDTNPIWLPIPSNVGESIPSDESKQVRLELNIREDQILLGHFGTYGESITRLLEKIIPKILNQHAEIRMLLMGRNSQQFTNEFQNKYPDCAHQLLATGGLSSEKMLAHLSACDLLLQPYPDGVSSRRTSVMASLAIGKTVISNTGPLTESIWHEYPIVELVNGTDPDVWHTRIESLLADPSRIQSIGQQAKEAYQQFFSLKNTVSQLRLDSKSVGNVQRKKRRIAFVVNGTSTGAMGQRAHAFASLLKDRFTIELFYRNKRNLSSIGQLMHNLHRFSPHICYIFDMALAGVISSIYAKIRNRTKMVIDTGDAIYELAKAIGRSSLGRYATKLLEKVSFQIGDKIVVRGRYHQKLLQQIGIDAIWIPDGVETDLFCPMDVTALRQQYGLEGRMVVGLVGSVIWNPKQQSCYGAELIEILHRIPNKNLHGILIGDGSGLDYLKQKCREYKLEDRIHFLGYIRYQELPRYLNLMDICLSTQTNDIPGQVRTTGKLPLYLACGRFVLASRVGEAANVLPESMLVDYQNAYDPEYATKLSERISYILQNPSLLREGMQNRSIALKEFDYQVLGQRLGDLLEQLHGY